MSDRSRSPILVTGAHRSATRWVSEAIARSPDGIAWIWEPFNPGRRPGTFAYPIRHAYWSVQPREEEAFRRALGDTLAFRYNVAAEVAAIRRPKDAARLVRDWSRFRQHRRSGCIPLLKDPIALMSTEWIERTFDARVAINVRHPAAFCASLVHRGWRFDFRDLLVQPELLAGPLQRWASEIARHAERPQPALDEAILLWNILYGRVGELQDSHPDYVVVRQEDLSRDPLPTFRRLLDGLGVTWSAAVEQFVLESSGASNPALDDNPSSVHRNSAVHMWNWSRQLDAAQVEQVREQTAEVSGRFYSDVDWTPPAKANASTEAAARGL